MPFGRLGTVVGLGGGGGGGVAVHKPGVREYGSYCFCCFSLAL